METGSENEDACIPCPLFSTTVEASSTSPDECVCQAEYFDTRREVTASNDGVGLDVFCKRCFVGTSCPDNEVGITLASLPLSAGYWRPTPWSVDIQRCPDAERSCGQAGASECQSGCLGGNDPAKACRGDLYGTFCQLCPDKLNSTGARPFYQVASRRNGPSHCEPCRDTFAITLGVVLGTLAVCMIIGGLLIPRALHMWERDKDAKWKKDVARLWRQTTPHNKIKILYGFYFIACKLPTVYQTTFPSQAESMLSGVELVIYLGADRLGTPLQCTGLGGYKNKLDFVMVVPILIATAIFLGALGKVLFGPKKHLKWRVVDMAIKSLELGAPLILRLIFLAYPFVTSIAFEAWVCDDFEEGSWLRADVNIKCGNGWRGEGSSAHQDVINTAIIAVVLYPFGIGVIFAFLLISARKAIIDERPSRLSTALQFLHREYLPLIYWWELMEMGRRVLLVGLLLVVVTPGSVLQSVIAQLTNTTFLFLQMRANPYKTLTDNWLAQICTFALSALFGVCVLIKVLELTQLSDIRNEMSPEQRKQFELSGLNATIWTCLIGTIVCTGLLLVSQVKIETERLRREARAAKARRLRYKDNDKEVGIKSPSCLDGFHLFLSHVWGTGQDQMRIVKQRLLEMIPDMHVFLDVDDLQDTSELEEMIGKSDKVLVFCSRGYFQSKNCLRELRAAVSKTRPILALFEPDKAKGLTQREVRNQILEGYWEDNGDFCKVQDLYTKFDFGDGPTPFELVASLFNSWPIEWNRIGCFQDVTLRHIALRVLPPNIQPTYVQHELSKPPVVMPAFGKAHHLFCSPHNEGALELVLELADHLDLRVKKDGHVTKGILESVGSGIVRMREATKNAAHNAADAMHVSGRRSSANNADESEGDHKNGHLAKKKASKLSKFIYVSTDPTQIGSCEHMLLYLNGHTWTRPQAASKLEEQIQRAKNLHTHILCAHEMPGITQSATHAVDFETFFVETPSRLLRQGLYDEIAVPLKGGEWRAVSLVLLGKSLVQSVTDLKKTLGVIEGRSHGNIAYLRKSEDDGKREEVTAVGMTTAAGLGRLRLRARNRSSNPNRDVQSGEWGRASGSASDSGEEEGALEKGSCMSAGEGAVADEPSTTGRSALGRTSQMVLSALQRPPSNLIRYTSTDSAASPRCGARRGSPLNTVKDTPGCNVAVTSSSPSAQRLSDAQRPSNAQRLSGAHSTDDLGSPVIPELVKRIGTASGKSLNSLIPAQFVVDEYVLSEDSDHGE